MISRDIDHSTTVYRSMIRDPRSHNGIIHFYTCNCTVNISLWVASSFRSRSNRKTKNHNTVNYIKKDLISISSISDSDSAVIDHVRSENWNSAWIQLILELASSHYDTGTGIHIVVIFDHTVWYDMIVQTDRLWHLETLDVSGKWTTLPDYHIIT